MQKGNYVNETNDVSEATFNLQTALKKERRRRKQRILISLAVAAILMIPAVIFLFLTTKGAAVRGHLAAYGQIPTKPCAVQVAVDEDMVLNVAACSTVTAQKYYLSFGTRDSGRWTFFQMKDWEIGFLNLNIPLVEGWCITQIGNYTVIYREAGGILAPSLLDSTYDNLGTERIRLAAEDIPGNRSGSVWDVYYVNFGRIDIDTVLYDTPIDLYFYFVKDMPDNYVFTSCGKTITAEDIHEALLRARTWD